MNIIKFKDSLRPDDSLFNSYLKGKYAYWVRMRYVVPFETMTPEEYVFCEHDDAYLKKFEGKYRDLFKDKALTAWVDEIETENLNDVQKYVRLNKHTTDPELTIDDVKKFRTWLAEQLLLLDQTVSGKQKYEFYSEEFTHVLEYYAQGMYDDVIKWLNKYGQMAMNFNIGKSTCGCVPTLNEYALNTAGTVGITGTGINTGCGCASSSNDMAMSLYSTCDPITVYRQAIKAKMVEYFGDMNFWLQFSVGFLSEFKAYIDNIIRLNLPFGMVNYTKFDDCLCGKSSSQLAAMEILGRLARALELMISGETVGNRNYISDAFMDWARDLYELMYWD